MVLKPLGGIKIIILTIRVYLGTQSFNQNGFLIILLGLLSLLSGPKETLSPRLWVKESSFVVSEIRGVSL